MNYYNEFDPYAADWLENLISFGCIAPGDVDRRSIVDVQPDDLKGYTQCHFFAGIGGWSQALKLAGWPDERPVWTGSCPCQPFSVAGLGKGTADERHLWPEFARLIAECGPPVVFGEQVASKDGREWLAGVRADLEALAYAVGAADLCAAGAGAPHIRQRLYWLADTNGGLACDAGLQRGGQHRQQPQDGRFGGLEHAASDGRVQRRAEPSGRGAVGGCGNDTERLGNADDTGLQGRLDGSGEGGRPDQRPAGEASVAGFWSTYATVRCTDGKARRFEPGSFPLAHGVSNRVGRLRGYGNAIVPQVAAEFVGAYMDIA
jgi:DNA (cytosine-5)-methyltransferase 1